MIRMRFRVDPGCIHDAAFHPPVNVPSSHAHASIPFYNWACDLEKTGAHGPAFRRARDGNKFECHGIRKI